MRPITAKILVHSEGLGAPNSEVVRKRAEELARISGRTKFSEEDWRQARIELHGLGCGEGNLADDMAALAMVSEQDMVASDHGRQTERVLMEDDGNVVEELFCEGMDEAVHERMLAAREESDDSEEE
jgi:hypothetical protein